jgi:hypothetical protein
MFTVLPHLRKDPNLTIECIHQVLDTLPPPLPRILYLQLDNCFRENKNRFVLGWLCDLVWRGVFDTIQVCFLPVGHTHCDVDQIFSRVSTYCKHIDFYTLSDLHCAIENSWVGERDGGQRLEARQVRPNLAKPC